MLYCYQVMSLCVFIIEVSRLYSLRTNLKIICLVNFFCHQQKNFAQQKKNVVHFVSCLVSFGAYWWKICSEFVLWGGTRYLRTFLCEFAYSVWQNWSKCQFSSQKLDAIGRNLAMSALRWVKIKKIKIKNWEKVWKCKKKKFLMFIFIFCTFDMEQKISSI